MNFKNAYDLNLFLFEKGLIEGLFLGIRGEYEIVSKIKDEKILNILNEIWGKWRWGETEGVVNATFGGFYNLYVDYNNNLQMSNSIVDDILDFDGNPFDIEKILEIISEYLLLDNLDEDEYLEFQICLDLELDCEILEDVFSYNFSDFKIKSYNKNDDLSKELSLKIVNQDIERLKSLILEYVIKIHKKNHYYEGFSLKIEDNNITNYVGKGFEYINDLKTYMINQLIDFDIDLPIQTTTKNL